MGGKGLRNAGGSGSSSARFPSLPFLYVVGNFYFLSLLEVLVLVP